MIRARTLKANINTLANSRNDPKIQFGKINVESHNHSKLMSQDRSSYKVDLKGFEIIYSTLPSIPSYL